MGSPSKDNLGLKRLVERFQREFRIPENTEHYGLEDYRAAEKKYVRFCLTGTPPRPESDTPGRTPG